MKKLPVQGSIEVNNNGSWEPATIIDLLSSQFTAENDTDYSFGYYFYTDEGDTWRQLREDS